jgi:acyl-CoA thioesterase-1
MRSFIRTVFAALLLTVAGVASGNGNVPSILVLGDSLSASLGVDAAEGWVALLQDRLEAEGYGYRVINASISGDTTGGGLRRLPRALDVHRPDIVVIELGGNDGLRGTPVEVIRDNLGQMIELSSEAGAGVVLTGMQMPPNYGAAYTDAFAGLYVELASMHDIAFVPAFIEEVALNGELMQADGIHPNAAGQPLLLDKVWPALTDLLQKRSAGTSAALEAG